ncbi:MAG: hypothetical protein VKP62_03390 [Candidatus Sericytochromatia bacterium]|nr:hypothetical protein [Candidatus Sericytochromatia bacterium]
MPTTFRLWLCIAVGLGFPLLTPSVEAATPPSLAAGRGAGAGITQPAPVVFERQLVWPAEGPYRLRVENVRGRVLVSRWEKNVAVLQVTLRASQALDAREQKIFASGRLDLDASETGGASATVAFPAASSQYPAVLSAAAPHIEVDWRVILPPETALEVKQETGPIVATGTDGRLNLFTRSGPIQLAGVSGRVDAGNELGDVEVNGLDGDAFLRSHHGRFQCRGVKGDLQVLSGTGHVALAVSPRWMGEVAYHTVSGEIRSDLTTKDTDMHPEDHGYVGVLQGSQTSSGHSPACRVQVDTTAGSLTIATDPAADRP